MERSANYQICRHKHRPHTNWLAFKRLKWQEREREKEKGDWPDDQETEKNQINGNFQDSSKSRSSLRFCIMASLLKINFKFLLAPTGTIVAIMRHLRSRTVADLLRHRVTIVAVNLFYMIKGSSCNNILDVQIGGGVSNTDINIVGQGLPFQKWQSFRKRKMSWQNACKVLYPSSPSV